MRRWSDTNDSFDSNDDDEHDLLVNLWPCTRFSRAPSPLLWLCTMYNSNDLAVVSLTGSMPPYSICCLVTFGSIYFGLNIFVSVCVCLSFTLVGDSINSAIACLPAREHLVADNKIESDKWAQNNWHNRMLPISAKSATRLEFWSAFRLGSNIRSIKKSSVQPSESKSDDDFSQTAA